MNTSYTSQLRREFDNMALLSDIASPEPNFITTGPRRQPSLEDNSDIYSDLSQGQNFKRRKTDARLEGAGLVSVKDKVTGKYILVEEDKIDLTKHERVAKSNVIDDAYLLYEEDEPTHSSQASLLIQPLGLNIAPLDDNIFSDANFIQYLTQKTNDKGFGKPKEPLKGITWHFGIFMSNKIPSTTFQLRVTEMAQTFCYVCMGFGHSRHNCLTDTKCKQIIKKLPMSAKLSFVLNQVLQCDALVQREYERGMKNDKEKIPWVLYKVIKQFAFYEITRLKEEQLHEQSEFETKIYASILQDLAAISVQCNICQGYGHSTVDKIFVKAKKNTLIKEADNDDTQPQKAKAKTKTNTLFNTESVVCKTKLRFEAVVLSEYFNQKTILAALAEWKQEQRQQVQNRRDTNLVTVFAAAQTMRQNTVANIPATLIGKISAEELEKQVVIAEKVKEAQQAYYEQQKQAHAAAVNSLVQAAAADPVKAWLNGVGLQSFFQYDRTTQTVPVDSHLAKIRQTIKGYKPLAGLHSIVLTEENNAAAPDEVKLKVAQTQKFPIFWFQCCPSSIQDNVCTEMYKLMHLNGSAAFTEQQIKDYAKLTGAADQLKLAADFHLFIYLLANSMVIKSQFLALRTICADEAAFAQLIALLYDVIKRKPKYEDYMVEQTEVASIPIRDVFDLFFDKHSATQATNLRDQGITLAKSWASLYDQNAYDLAVTTKPLKLSWLGNAFTSKKTSYVDALKDRITEIKDDLAVVSKSAVNVASKSMEKFQKQVSDAVKKV